MFLPLFQCSEWHFQNICYLSLFVYFYLCKILRKMIFRSQSFKNIKIKVRGRKDHDCSHHGNFNLFFVLVRHMGKVLFQMFKTRIPFPFFLHLPFLAFPFFFSFILSLIFFPLTFAPSPLLFYLSANYTMLSLKIRSLEDLCFISNSTANCLYTC